MLLQLYMKLGLKNNMMMFVAGDSIYSLFLVLWRPSPVLDHLTSESCHLTDKLSVYTFPFHFPDYFLLPCWIQVPLSSPPWYQWHNWLKLVKWTDIRILHCCWLYHARGCSAHEPGVSTQRCNTKGKSRFNSIFLSFFFFCF